MNASPKMSKWWQTILILGLVVAALVLAYHLRLIFVPLLIAFLLTYIWNPVVTALEIHMPRLAAIMLVYAGFLGGVAALALMGTPVLVNQAVVFVEEGFIGERITVDFNRNGRYDPGDRFEDANQNGKYDPPKFGRFASWSEEKLQEWIGGEEGKELLTILREKLRGHEGDVLQAAQKVGRVLLEGALTGIHGTLAVLSFCVLVPVYMFFLLKNMNSWWERFQEIIPEAYQERLLRALERIHEANAAFFRGQILIALIEGTILFVVLTALGVKLSLFFGGLYAVLAMVPFVGVVVTFTVTSLFVLAETGGFGTVFFLVVGLFIFIQALESLVLQPVILGQQTGLHPMVVILAIFIFGELFGFLGVLLAIPLASATLILSEEYLLPLIQGEWGDESL
ncbi:MAG: AI-2E family transporter [Planctomycetes bacterium]|nr:AI-2E family transporter [Planctomycetota bacterium]